MKKQFAYEARRCECCGGNDLELLWAYDYTSPTRNSLFDFSVRNMICVECGFVFVSPVPEEQDLASYYADSFTYWEGQSLDYDVEKRIAFIREQLGGTGVFLEIGSNATGPFHRQLGKIFSEVLTSEINRNVESTYRTLAEFPSGYADMIGHYFVLEHITRVRDFFKACRSALKDDGIMICEVPDLALYPEDISGLMLCEHMNHFSLNSLTRIAAQSGFQLKAHSTGLSSRSFGFAACFIKGPEQADKGMDSVYSENKKLFLRGLEKVEEMKRGLEGYRTRLREYVDNGRKAILWAANDILMRFLDGSVPPVNTMVIDSNPARKHYTD
ncbi:methyltransferase domain-containing protein, partial [archaeon]|nr:methyltransferase domain-containing protein [archaeon]